ncbi:hypothetical protein BK125_20820 [Paenibacillus odorifer]|uniref:ParB/Sulfiredoxin domain-containing protein n=1 Tax=Paenibacillus odorifer TaxID=189426 RepID=A0ABX3GHG9_9BACL|nr:hypothetical protein [Paenibacillus odorifer]OMC74246.1 hypothetical protein BK125_20820 [Paenibacillus odorifer]OMD06298.1 hypothetical protein BSO21_30815 [Paenibacillus odorifer]
MILDLNINKTKAIHSIIDLIEAIKTNADLNMNEHPNYIEHCDKLKKILITLLEIKEEIIIPMNEGELYVREHVLPNGDTYEFAWSIPLLERLIKNNGGTVIRKKYKIGEVISFVDYGGLENDRFDFALQNTKPIYVIDYAASDLSIMIDGNHRVASRYRVFEDAEMLIPGIFIPADIHIKSMATNHQRIVFRVLSNGNRIYKYLKMLSEGTKTKKPKLFNMDSFL